MTRARQVGGSLFKILLCVSDGLIVDARANFGHNVVEKQRGFQIANWLVQVVVEISAKCRDTVFAGVLGNSDRRFFWHGAQYVARSRDRKGAA